MAEKTVIKTLSDFFNEGEGKRPLTDFAKEIRELSPEEKLELAQGVCAITGDTIKA